MACHFAACVIWNQNVCFQATNCSSWMAEMEAHSGRSVALKGIEPPAFLINRLIHGENGVA
jgi:hypothetical protein